MGHLIDDLLRVYDLVDLPGGRQARVRALSDTEQRQRALEADRVAALLQRALRDPASPQYESIILPLLMLEPEVQKQQILGFRSTSAAREAVRDIHPTLVPIPDNASDEERRDVQLKREDQAKELLARQQAWVDAEINKLKAEIEPLQDGDLTARLQKLAASGNADAEWTSEFIAQTLYLAVETEDGKRRYFPSVEAVRSIARSVRMTLWSKYMEVDRVDPFFLGSPAATESLTG